MNKAKAQELFNDVLNHLHDQGGPALDEDGECVYFNKENNRYCAIGCLMNPDYYDIILESNDVSSLFIRHVKLQTDNGFSQVFPTIPADKRDDYLNLLNNLQKIHDEPRNYTYDCWDNSFYGEMEKVARKYKLKFPAKFKKYLN